MIYTAGTPETEKSTIFSIMGTVTPKEMCTRWRNLFTGVAWRVSAVHFRCGKYPKRISKDFVCGVRAVTLGSRWYYEGW